ncbi:MAG: GTPase HflX [Treponema sp.]|uniref:GTPase HflX n=1 Tax=Treponema sp. TaxID=166 RepID=UPI0025DEEF09|nr:GTPase HflX [Treponema sp.]MBQ9281944.1 GTPase HflX [Treponema sp.]
MELINLEEEEEKKIRALLVGEPKADISELEGLVDTLGYEKARSIILNRMEQNPVYGIGKGKAEEIAALSKELEADIIIFDFELTPRKQRNWEKLAKIPVIDRQEVILRIFADRAQTKEAVLQVQLAQLEYARPRLAHSYGDMARQRGGNFGSKGSGETQLELDTRKIREKIQQLKKELEQVVRERETQRKKREKVPLPTCALAGYTNAGKSSLLNALTGADVFVEDKLFATLDPTTRKLQLKSSIKTSEDEKGFSTNILLTDTVGFISNLPHSLVNAFKSTLEEAQRAHLILLVLDASDEKAEFQYNTVVRVLEEIGAENTPRLIVLNKIDKLSENPALLAKIMTLFPDAVKVSAKTHEGFEELSSRICDELLGEELSYIFPLEKQNLLNEARKTGIITEENWLDDGIHVKIKGGELKKNPRLSALLTAFAENAAESPIEVSSEIPKGFKKKFGADW